MTGQHDITPLPARRPVAGPLAEQRRRRVRLSPTYRSLQCEAIDAWICARRAREQVLAAVGLACEEGPGVADERRALRRTHDVIKSRCALGLGAAPEPM